MFQCNKCVFCRFCWWIADAFALDRKLLLHSRLHIGFVWTALAAHFLLSFVHNMVHFFLNTHYNGIVYRGSFCTLHLCHKGEKNRIFACFMVSTCHTWVIAWEAWCQRSYIRSKGAVKVLDAECAWMRQLTEAVLGSVLAQFEGDWWIIRNVCVCDRLSPSKWQQGADAKLLSLSVEHMFGLRDRATWIKQ